MYIRFVNSWSGNQLRGEDLTDEGTCEPLDHNGSDVTFLPCGVIANSFFNGKISGQCIIYIAWRLLSFPQHSYVWLFIVNHHSTLTLKPENWIWYACLNQTTTIFGLYFQLLHNLDYFVAEDYNST